MQIELEIQEKNNIKDLTALEVISQASSLATVSLDGSIELYKKWLDCHGQDPVAFAIWFNLGVLQKDIGQEMAAEESYRHAVRLNPNCLEAQFNLGSQLERLDRPLDAVTQWQSIIESENYSLPKDQKIYLMTLNNLGRILENLKKYEQAEAMLLRSLGEDHNQPDAIQHLVYLRQKQCKWPIYPEITGLDRNDMARAVGPLSMLAISDDPAEHLERMCRYAEEKIPKPERTLSDGRPYGHPRIRVGYLSSDYCLHPVSMLTVELFELHDREKFEIFGFCWSRDDGSSLRQRVIKAFDHYIYIGKMTDEEAAKLIRSCEVDILIDLHGLTLGARPSVITRRPAPIQVTYLGFPGTTGIPGADYVLADKFLLPSETAQYFTEQPLFLPHCFQVSDRHKHIGVSPSKADYDLPVDKFIFCCFNNNYKITSEIFLAWMEILKSVPNSVLWLLADNSWVKDNLTKVAAGSGVDPGRLIFAGRVSPEDYQARYQLADLFLDTRPFGAGTTANDALGQGLPLLTCPGKTFASRMAGSLLNTLGIPELIAASIEDYKEIAIALGSDSERTRQLKLYLKQRIKNSSLFDIPRTVKEIERLFLDKVTEHRQGKVSCLSKGAEKLEVGKFTENFSRAGLYSGGVCIEIVSATRHSFNMFWQESALGRSLKRLAYDSRIIANITYENNKGLSEIYNEIIASDNSADVLLFIHDDVWIDDYYLADRILSGLAIYDVIGVAGNKRAYPNQFSWALLPDGSMDDASLLSGFVGHGEGPFGEVTPFGICPSECEFIDGVFIAVAKRTVKTRGVLFDPRFKFHFYDLDFCKTARKYGLKLGVWPISITHQSTGSYDSDAWKDGLGLYRKKWQ